jgi:hypothetical protein
MLIDQRINELRSEMNGCLLTRRERAEAQAELKRLLAAQAERERAFDAALEALHSLAEATGAA